MELREIGAIIIDSIYGKLIERLDGNLEISIYINYRTEQLFCTIKDKKSNIVCRIGVDHVFDEICSNGKTSEDLCNYICTKYLHYIKKTIVNRNFKEEFRNMFY